MEKKQEYTPMEVFLAEGGASKRIGADKEGLTWKGDDGQLKSIIGVDAKAWNVRERNML